MGRDAWIDTKKREYVARVKTGLKNGEYTEEFLREHIGSGDQGISEQAYLQHEKTGEEATLPPMMQEAVNAWINTPADDPKRREKVQILKSIIESSYPTVTTDLSQLEQSLLRLERSKISSEVETLDAKLRILDIGRIERGNGQRKE